MFVLQQNGFGIRLSDLKAEEAMLDFRQNRLMHESKMVSISINVRILGLRLTPIELRRRQVQPRSNLSSRWLVFFRMD